MYSLFVAIDANFRLKLKTRGIKDPELGTGLAYFVNVPKFEAHLKSHVEEGEVSVYNSFVVRRRTHTLKARDVWDRVPRGQPSKFEAVDGFHRVRCGRSGLPTRPRPQERSR